METPSPFTPGNWPSKAGVTAALMMFVVLPALARPWKTKSSSVTEADFLQG